MSGNRYYKVGNGGNIGNLSFYKGGDYRCGVKNVEDMGNGLIGFENGG